MEGKYRYHRGLEDKVLRGPKNINRTTEEAVKFVEKVVSQWSGQTTFAKLIDSLAGYLDAKDVAFTRLEKWGLLVINGDSRTRADKNLCSLAARQLSKDLLQEVESKGNHVLAIQQEGVPSIQVYRTGRVAITLVDAIPSTKKVAWAAGTRIVRMDKDGEILYTEEVAA